MILSLSKFSIVIAILLSSAAVVCAQEFVKEVPLAGNSQIEIVNLSGRTSVRAVSGMEAAVRITAGSSVPVTESEVKIANSKGRLRIDLAPAMASKRIDLLVEVPTDSSVRVTSREGEIQIVGALSRAWAKSDTGTIVTDVPLTDLQYKLQWLTSRPRILADFELEKVRERAGGRFEINGKHKGEPVAVASDPETEEPAAEAKRQKPLMLEFTTDRGIILLNVPVNEVTSDLRERPLTEAAKAIIKSGDSVLMNAIRRAAPKYFGEYERTLPPIDRRPVLTERERQVALGQSSLRTAMVRVTDNNNRAIAGLTKEDFEMVEGGRPVEMVDIRPISSPVNLVLLLDVSGSVDNYVNFIRKAARSFIDTVDAKDRISIVLFNEDVKVLSGFSTDKARLSESLDSFDAGGATAYYDSLGFTLAETLRPLRGERSAIVVLTDGDDNRSFLAFDSLAGAIEESGSLIYPLYVPTGLIAAAETTGGAEDIDPLRNRHLTLTSKASAEGPQLAELSGGVFYPISRLTQIDEAYEDIALQLRTAYEITYRSNANGSSDAAPSRLRVRMKRPGTFGVVTSIVAADTK